MNQNIAEVTFNGRDEFQRRSIAEKVIALLKSNIDVSPMVIDGGWGTGKTEFCHKTINLMAENDSHHLIYVDAFQADHADEPLLTVLAEVLKIIPDEEKRTGLIQKAIPAIRFGLKTALKAGVAHILRQDAADVVEGLDEEIQKTADKAIDASVESLLKDHIKASESLKSLQKALGEIAAQKPIILFIDELDRCRPDFAVSMLEIIKHTFAVKGVKFILITNTDQLKASINHCYGNTIDAQRYLDKFLKFSFTLPQIQRDSVKAQMVSELHYRNLVSRSSSLKESKVDDKYSLELVTQIIKTNKISLREVESFVRYLEIYQELSGEHPLSNNTILGYRLLIILAVALFCFKPKLTQDLIIERADASQLGAFLGENKIPDINGRYPYPEVHIVALVMIGQECDQSSDLFTPSEGEQTQNWDELISRFFYNDHFPPEVGDRTKIMTNVFNLLSLK